MTILYNLPLVIVSATITMFSLPVHLIDAASNPAAYPQRLESCNIGDIIQNECHKCVCSQNFYQCSSLRCNKGNKEKDVLSDEIKSTCHSNMIYVENSTTCICGHNGLWPHKHCDNVFGALPAGKTTKQRCDPDSYVIVDCNVCRCNSYGDIDRSKCTKNDCETKRQDSRRTTNVDKVYGECEPKNWYSFAPCQFCYCVHENKLVCNTRTNRNTKPIELGTYKLDVCGENLLQDAIGLIPDGQQILRYGNEKKETSNTKARVHKTTKISNIEINSASKHKPANEDVEIQANREIDETNKDDDEDDSDDVDLRPEDEHKKIAREGSSTALPLLDDSDVSSESNEMTIPIKEEVKLSKTPLADMTKPRETVSKPHSNEAPEKILRINFPKMLDNLLNLALRKSMVKLDTGSQCKPGSTKNVACNTCFCLVNGKMLCTDKVCQ